MKSTTATIVAPSFGPAVVTVFGTDVPVLALGLSVAGLMLARVVAPPTLRKLSRKEEAALTLLLLVFLFLAVTGQVPLIGNGKPMGPGMAVVWGAGLGFSGLLVVELMGDRVMAMLRAAMGVREQPKPTKAEQDLLDKMP